MVDLSIVIVNWNVLNLLRRCLDSILADETTTGGRPYPYVRCGQGNHGGLPLRTGGTPCPPVLQVIVVDNGSTDGSVAMVRAEFPAVHLIANQDNRGFTAANNQGLSIARGRYVLLLNPDTEVVGDALSTLVAFADEHPDVGMVGPKLLNPDGSVQSSRRRLPTPATAFFESTWLEHCAPRRLLERYYVQDRPDDVVQDVDWITGAAMLARREAIEEVGPLDEGFFMYSEELDWCRRFGEAGWRVVYLPAAQIIHHVGKSSEQVVAARHIHFQTSKVRYFRKYHGPLMAEALRWFMLGNYVWQIGVEGAKWLLGHKRSLRAQRIAAYRKVLRSGLRP
jgi:N-acetylglucosaminyl-diphospho-decaprenol L-rhamnosyltransferase